MRAAFTMANEESFRIRFFLVIFGFGVCHSMLHRREGEFMCVCVRWRARSIFCACVSDGKQAPMTISGNSTIELKKGGGMPNVILYDGNFRYNFHCRDPHSLIFTRN